MESITRFFNPSSERSVTFIVGATAITTAALVSLIQCASQGTQPKIIKSPTATLLPSLSDSEAQALPYPPDALPGGRNVNSPYGVARVYEWGPEGGRKVLLIHGITTPCIALGAVAHGLVENGCRVMLMDLWGRGYSDSCADLQHDDRLYSTEILLAVTSSSLSWIGGPDGGFSIVGYSLGGGIAAAFTSYFPQMVKSLVLMAPAGLIRPVHMSGSSKLLYSTGFVPERLLQWSVRKRLQTPLYANENKKTDVRDAATAEVEGGAEFSFQDAPLSKTRPDLTVVAAVRWQLRAHQGFVHSFMSSIRYAPIVGQHESWRRLGLRDDKTLIFAGTTDPIIYVEELRDDAEATVGKDKIEYRVIEGAHDFPITNADEIVGIVCDFWGIQPRA
ncbi:MAG: hypothetical protein M1818_007669 [Claussenomyces sp. TS43310]|nr:MAG: hypothetical protein M1818_007669 [Claussenomyces sp. TS43310]